MIFIKFAGDSQQSSSQLATRGRWQGHFNQRSPASFLRFKGIQGYLKLHGKGQKSKQRF